MAPVSIWKLQVAAAFAVVYLVWGSTYLAIRIGVAELPPLLFAGARFLAAGALLALYALARGQRPPRTAREWRLIVVVGLLLLAAANGLVVWGEQWVPSNQAALIAATTALWLAGLGTLGRHGHTLDRETLVGLLTGLAGVVLLLLPRGGFVLDYLGAQLAILAAGFCWAAGSIYAKHRRPATPPLMSAALQSLVAGAALCAGGLAAGETGRWDWQAGEALAALAYLIVFGSCLAYAAYLWLLHAVRPALLGTYAYVNPLVAVALGGWLLDETLDTLQWLGMLVILLGVVLVSRASQRETAPAARN
jgi:drug/metabolite transporter (DMT)-like permease